MHTYIFVNIFITTYAASSLEAQLTRMQLSRLRNTAQQPGLSAMAATVIAGQQVQGLLLRLKLMKPSTKHFSILDDVSAIIPSGRMTLLLGPPGAGKSTLLAALAGKLQSTNLKVSQLQM